MLSVIRPRAVILAAIFALAASLPSLFTALNRRDVFFLEIPIAAKQSAPIQLFYDVGRSWNPQDCASDFIDAGEELVTKRFPLPSGTFRQFRFDPMTGEGSAVIGRPRVVDRDGRVIREFSTRDFGSPIQIARLTTRRTGELEVQAAPGSNDPALYLTPDRPLTLRLPVGLWAKSATGIALFVFVGVLGISALPAQANATTRVKGFVAWLQARPYQALALASLVIVAIQCRPVIFFGKSFVSPNNGAVLLYDTYPVLPSYTNVDIEDTKASDIGAMMYWHLYCPVIAHNAIFRDGELPLWNRYSMNGLPALGQGQFMLGDPLNWLNIVTRSAAWSWDVRFVVSRWLLCFGLGLTVLVLARSLPAALLVSVAAGFLGFFGYRLNHAANFTLGYAPWILFAWARLAHATGTRSAVRWALLLLFANFCVMTSGTVKEAYIAIACLNFAGVLIAWFQPRPVGERVRLIGLASTAGAVLLLFTAPLWLTFLSALTRSWTSYDAPRALQEKPSMAISFFDDLFARQEIPFEGIHLPAANFFVLIGVLWAMATLRERKLVSPFGAIGLAAIPPLLLIYGVIPATWIGKIPFLSNIWHIDNTFLCPAIILALVFAGFGFDSAIREHGTAAWKPSFTLFVVFLTALVGLYFGSTQSTPKSDFFTGYAFSLILTAAVLPVGLHSARRNADHRLAAAVLACGIALLTWRHAQFIQTSFDDYVFNPKDRADLHPESPAVKFVDQQMKEPSRPYGLGLSLWPSYNVYLGWEHILGVDPLRNRYHDEIAGALEITRVLRMDASVDDQRAAELGKRFDVFNIRYYVTMHSQPAREIPGLRLIGQFDMDVYERESAWPRGFFADRVTRYSDANAFAQLVKSGDGRPFAAIANGEPNLPAAVRQISPRQNERAVRNATNYRLTNNTTSFEVEAPSAGVIVLAENFYPGEFRVKVNGRPTPYFRVNHSSKGVHVAAPGTYRVEFSYWPAYMTLSLALAAVGALGIAGLAWLAVRADREATATA